MVFFQTCSDLLTMAAWGVCILKVFDANLNVRYQRVRSLKKWSWKTFEVEDQEFVNHLFIQTVRG